MPLVDFGPFLHGSDDDKKAVAAQIDDAFRNVGFVYLANHGVPGERVDECFKWVGEAALLLRTDRPSFKHMH